MSEAGHPVISSIALFHVIITPSESIAKVASGRKLIISDSLFSLIARACLFSESSTKFAFSSSSDDASSS
ncbi:MAG: hypothetical protein BWY05_00515 [Euryarchaeota archaeon ADurb.Bin165]|nr:MAG: hypothetical protein BWY05_00515 [Euryarchaeota archaeon ADurb.Bin165]